MKLLCYTFQAFVFLIFTVSFTFSQTDAWYRINPVPVESNMMDIQILPDNSTVIAGEKATIIISTDNGTTWEIIHCPAGISRHSNIAAIFFVDSYTGYLCGTKANDSYKSLILRTLDGGFSWFDVSPDLDFELWDICFLDSQNGYATGKDNVILKTDNAGLIWDTINPGYNTWYEGIQFVNDSVGFMSGYYDSVYFKTTDCGNVWEKVDIFPENKSFWVYNVYFLNADTGVLSGQTGSNPNYFDWIFKTVNGGITWYVVDSSLSLSSSREFCFINADTGFSLGDTYYANQIRRTIDGGENWQLYPDYVGSWFSKDIEVSNTGFGFSVGYSGQIYKTGNYGDSWEKAYTSLDSWSFIVSQIASDSVVYASTYTPMGGGFFKSMDCGLTWEKIMSEVRYIHFLSKDYGYLGESFDVYKTMDGGETYSWCGPFPYNSYYLNKVLFFQDTLIGFGGGTIDYCDTAVILKTTDGALSWTRSNINDPDVGYSILDLTFINETKGFAVGGDYNTNGVLLKTTDGGLNWEIQEEFPENGIFKIRFINDVTGFAVGRNIILKTVDGGNSWYEIPNIIQGEIIYRDICFPSDDIGYLTGTENQQSLFKSMDGGESWFPVDAPTTYDIFCLEFFNEDEGIVLGENATIFKTYTGGHVGLQDRKPGSEESILWRYHPNPFSSQIRFERQTTDEMCEVRIFNISGKLIRTFTLSHQKSFIWNGNDQVGSPCSQGVYFCIFETSNSIDACKVMKIKSP